MGQLQVTGILLSLLIYLNLFALLARIVSHYQATQSPVIIEIVGVIQYSALNAAKLLN